MNRREFLKQSAVAGGVLFTGESLCADEERHSDSWKLQLTAEPCSVGVVEGWTVAERVQFLQQWGFAGVHVSRLSGPNEMDLTETSRAARAAGIPFATFTGCCDLWSSDWVSAASAAQRRVRDLLHNRVQLAQRIGADSFTVTPGCLTPAAGKAAQQRRLCDHLRYCCELSESHGVKVLLDPISFPEWQGKMILSSLADAVSVAAAVNHPLCRVKARAVHTSLSEVQSALCQHPGMIEMISLGESWKPDDVETLFDELEVLRFTGWVGMRVAST